jgi:hypothetical protein
LLGAVKMTVVLVLPLAGMLPVSALQGFLFEVVGLPAVTTVVVYSQVQPLTSVLVEPVIIAVNVTDWETMTELGPDTLTVTTFVLLPPPQPARANQARAARLSRKVAYCVRNFVTTRTPKFSPAVSAACELF